eukprot:scaffold4264_cov116-Isochrysis_galbana.AAC.4
MSSTAPSTRVGRVSLSSSAAKASESRQSSSASTAWALIIAGSEVRICSSRWRTSCDSRSRIRERMSPKLRSSSRHECVLKKPLPSSWNCNANPASANCSATESAFSGSTRGIGILSMKPSCVMKTMYSCSSSLWRSKVELALSRASSVRAVEVRTWGSRAHDSRRLSSWSCTPSWTQMCLVARASRLADASKSMMPAIILESSASSSTATYKRGQKGHRA